MMGTARSITYSEIYSVNCFYYTAAFKPNGYLFCEYPNMKFFDQGPNLRL